MTITQPKELNAMVLRPLTWARRWELLKVSLPMLVLVLVGSYEMVLLNLWLRDLPETKVPVLLVSPLLLVAFALAIAELSSQLEKRSKRRLKLGERAAYIRPARPERIPMKCVLAWEFEPVPDRPECSKLTLVYAWSKKISRRWSLIIKNPEDRELLVAELKQRLRIAGTYAINELPQPRPQTPKAPNVRGIWFVIAGYFLFVHGAPLVAVALSRHDDSKPSRLNSQNAAKIGAALHRHFSSVQQLNRFFLITGLTLTSSGVAICVWSARRRFHDVKRESAIALQNG